MVLAVFRPKKRGLVDSVLAFARLLKQSGMDITPGRVIDACRSLTFIDIGRRGDFYAALRANLVSRYDDLAPFDALFAMFWRFPEEEEALETLVSRKPADQLDEEDEGEEVEINEARVRRVLETEGEQKEIYLAEREEKPEEGKEEEWQPFYSPDEVLATKDFATFTDEEIKRVRQIIQQIAPKIATTLSRRKHPNPKGVEIDLRRTLRSSLKHGGEIIELTRRRKKIKKLKILLLCDVSGSMDCYSRFFIQFIYALQNELRGIETFVFSTRLTNITKLLRRRTYAEALEQLCYKVKDWSGGTNIGGCLHAFNVGVGRDRVGSTTVIVIISDGWDRGDSKLLEEEMELLKRRAYKVIWLNPLLGSPNYQPLCKGMKAALPYADYFLPVHNIKSLVELGRALILL